MCHEFYQDYCIIICKLYLFQIFDASKGLFKGLNSTPCGPIIDVLCLVISIHSLVNPLIIGDSFFEWVRTIQLTHLKQAFDLDCSTKKFGSVLVEKFESKMNLFSLVQIYLFVTKSNELYLTYPKTIWFIYYEAKRHIWYAKFSHIIIYSLNYILLWCSQWIPRVGPCNHSCKRRGAKRHKLNVARETKELSGKRKGGVRWNQFRRFCIRYSREEEKVKEQFTQDMFCWIDLFNV